MQLSENKLHKIKTKFRKIYGKNVRIMKEILTLLKENTNKRAKKQTNDTISFKTYFVPCDSVHV